VFPNFPAAHAKHAVDPAGRDITGFNFEGMNTTKKTARLHLLLMDQLWN
jgi:hypothetical protein